MKSFREFIDEEAVAVNSAGGGAIAGIGVGPQGEPGIRRPRGRRHEDEKKRFPRRKRSERA